MTRNSRFALGLLSFMTFSAEAVGEVLAGPLAKGGGGRIVRHQARRVRLIQSGQPAGRPRGFPRAGLAVRPNLALCVRRIAVSCVFGNGCNDRLQARNTKERLLGRSVITGNGTGVSNNTSSNTFYSYGDNRINLNGTDGFSSLNTAFVTH
jgi:hypothetical protein